MSYATLILGESGTGKTCSLRNLDPKKTLLIQPVRKPLPFRAKDWHEGKGGSVFVCNDARKIVEVMRKAPHEVIVLDDWQYILASQFMARRNEKSFDKFTDIGGAGYDLLKCASELGTKKRVYVIAHTQTDDQGNVRIKTLGRLLDEKIVPEGMFTIVLRTFVDQQGYMFSTQNNGHDTVKSPMGMFTSTLIENDLAEVDRTICEYYGLEESEQEQAEPVAFEVSVKVDELLQAIEEASSIERLNELCGQIKALNLPHESKERAELLNAYKAKKTAFEDELNNI